YGEKIDMRGANRPVANQGVDTEDLTPKFSTEQNDRNAFSHFPGLHQRQYFKQFIQSAESARKEHHRFRQINEPEFAHEKIMEVEMKFATDIGIVKLLIG